MLHSIQMESAGTGCTRRPALRMNHLENLKFDEELRRAPPKCNEVDTSTQGDDVASRTPAPLLLSIANLPADLSLILRQKVFRNTSGVKQLIELI
jgi:hypothetical protein